MRSSVWLIGRGVMCWGMMNLFIVVILEVKNTVLIIEFLVVIVVSKINIPVVIVVFQGVAEVNEKILHFCVCFDTITKSTLLYNLCNLLDCHKTRKILNIIDP